MHTDCIAAELPLSPPAAHADRVVTLIERHPDKNFRLQKAYKWAAKAHHPTHEAGTWPASGATDAGCWEDASKIAGSSHSSRECWLDTLEDWAGLLNLLATKPGIGIVAGRLKDAERWAPCDKRWLVFEKTRQGYEDRKSRWLLLDLTTLLAI